MNRFIPGILAVWLMAYPAAGMGPQRLEDIDGGRVAPLDVTAGGHASVLLFLRTDCPISNRYAPEIRRLFDAFSRQGVAFWLVFPNPAEPAAAIRDHVQTFGYSGHVVRDPDHALVRLAGATITPEAAVVDPRGRVVYHGRIDDRFANLGVDRQIGGAACRTRAPGRRRRPSQASDLSVTSRGSWVSTRCSTPSIS